VIINQNDLTALIDNVRSQVKQWRSSLGEHGELPTSMLVEPSGWDIH